MFGIGLWAKVVRVVVLGVVVVVVVEVVVVVGVVGGRNRVTVVDGRMVVVVVVDVVVCAGDSDGELIGKSTDDGVDRFVQLFHQEYLLENPNRLKCRI